MKKYLVAVALAASLAQPAAAITFPTLTTIYVGSGVTDNGGASQTGVATTIFCSNVSGADVQVRVLILSAGGSVRGTPRTATLVHGQTGTFSTHATALFTDEDFLLNTGSVGQGVVNVEATNSAIFCTATILDAAASVPNGIPLHLVRVNPHPGTVE